MSQWNLLGLAGQDHVIVDRARQGCVGAGSRLREGCIRPGREHGRRMQYAPTMRMTLLRMALRRLEAAFGDRIERVMAVGNRAVEGIDLDALPYADVVIQIVLRSGERPLSLH